jgi:hypothetical protein
MKSVFKKQNKSKNNKTKCKKYSKIHKDKQSKKHKIKGGDIFTGNDDKQDTAPASAIANNDTPPNPDSQVIVDGSVANNEPEQILPVVAEQTITDSDSKADTDINITNSNEENVQYPQSTGVENPNPEFPVIPNYDETQPQYYNETTGDFSENPELPKSGCNCEVDCPVNSAENNPESKKSLLNSMFSSIQNLFIKPKDDNTHPVVGGKKYKSKKCKKQNRVKKNKTSKSSVKKQK